MTGRMNGVCSVGSRPGCIERCSQDSPSGKPGGPCGCIFRRTPCCGPPVAEAVDTAPHFVECVGIFGVIGAYAMYFIGEAADVVVGFGFHQLIESVADFTVDHLYGTDGAYAFGVVVGGFNIYCNEVIHFRRAG